MKMTSRFAMVAAAGVLLGAAVTSAKAADLGGGCCADLEERVAELEATTARKGNRVVSLQVYGQVNKALLIFDDGEDSDAFIADHDGSGSRIGFVGKAALKPGWTAGFNIEIDIQDAASNALDQGFTNAGLVADGDDPADEIIIRYSNVYIESERLGRITLGQQSAPADGAAEVVLGNSLSNSGTPVGNDLFVRGAGNPNSLQVDNFVDNLDGDREDLIRYDSPSIYGFILSASWGDDDYWDVALRFKKEWNSIRIAGAVSYIYDDSNIGPQPNTLVGTARSAGDTTEILLGSISVMHVPTGIYGAFQAGNGETDDGREASYWYAQLGLEKKFLSYGATTVYAEYGLYEDLVQLTRNPAQTNFGDDSEAEKWGFGVVQKFDSAAMELYAQAQFFSFELDGDDDLEDLTTVMIGSRIKF